MNVFIGLLLRRLFSVYIVMNFTRADALMNAIKRRTDLEWSDAENIPSKVVTAACLLNGPNRSNPITVN